MKNYEFLDRPLLALFYRAILEKEMTSSNDPQLKFWPH